MSDVNFLKKLEEYDKEHIPDTVTKKIKTYVDHKDFQPAVRLIFFINIVYGTIVVKTECSFLADHREGIKSRQVYVSVGDCHRKVRKNL